MANRTLTQATALAGVDIASNDELWIWDVTAAALRKCTRADLIGGVITGGGTVATGGFTLTVPATGTAALRDVANTFTQAQTFSGVLTAPGIKPASDSTTAVQIQDAGGTAILTVNTTSDIVTSVGSLTARLGTTGNAAAVEHIFAGLDKLSLGAGQYVNVTMAQNCALLFIDIDHYSSLHFVTGDSATIVELADPISVAPSIVELSKSNNSSVVKIKNVSGISRTMAIKSIGQIASISAVQS